LQGGRQGRRGNLDGSRMSLLKINKGKGP